MHRDAPGERRHEDDAEQDRPQRRAGAGPDHAHGLVPAGPCQKPRRPGLALPSGARSTVLNEMRAIENVVRAILREAGIKLGTPARAAFAHACANWPAMIRRDAIVEPLLAILGTMLDELARLTKQVLALARGKRSAAN